jgi:hypothetical protein
MGPRSNTWPESPSAPSAMMPDPSSSSQGDRKRSGTTKIDFQSEYQSRERPMSGKLANRAIRSGPLLKTRSGGLKNSFSEERRRKPAQTIQSPRPRPRKMGRKRGFPPRGRQEGWASTALRRIHSRMRPIRALRTPRRARAVRSVPQPGKDPGRNDPGRADEGDEARSQVRPRGKKGRRAATRAKTARATARGRRWQEDGQQGNRNGEVQDDALADPPGRGILHTQAEEIPLPPPGEEAHVGTAFFAAGGAGALDMLLFPPGVRAGAGAPASCWERDPQQPEGRPSRSSARERRPGAFSTTIAFLSHREPPQGRECVRSFRPPARRAAHHEGLKLPLSPMRRATIRYAVRYSAKRLSGSSPPTEWREPGDRRP